MEDGGGMTVVSFRISKELKREMKHTRSNWSKDVRTFIAGRIKEQKRRRSLEQAISLLEKTPTATKGSAARYVRGDRDSH
jgi:hypothetical protein